jgi:murein tripeptide amidase MpaA
MVNPDGVVLGNYRCGLAGNDLNRRWSKPNKQLHPSVYFIKKYIKAFGKERQIILLCDLHGHSHKYQCTHKLGKALSSTGAVTPATKGQLTEC